MARSSVIAFLFYFFASYPANAGKETWTQCVEDKSQSLYNFTTKYLNGKPVSLKEYRGVVTLVLNVATYCKFTYQYPHLNALMQAFPAGRYKCGFSILAFPCNQFMHQEPGADYREIFNGLIFVRPGFGFKPFFPLFQKIEVNGKNEDQMYTFLKSRCPLPGGVVSQDASSMLWSPVKSNDISWNFEKFLVDHQGFPVKRYLPSTKPLHLVGEILRLIRAC